MRDNRIIKFLDRYIGIPLVFFFGLLSKFQSKSKEIPEISSILVIKLSAIGDTILLIPALRELKNKYPQARISMIVTAVNIKAVKNCPYVDDILELEIPEIIKNPLAIINFIKKVKSYKFNVAIDADQWLRLSALLTFFSGAAKRIGFKTKNQFKHYFFNEVIPHERGKHEIDCFFELVAGVGFCSDNKELEYWISDENKIEADRVLKEQNIDSGNFIIIHPEVPEHAFQRQWPEENFSELINKLAEKKDFYIALAGTNMSKKMIARLISRCSNKKRVIDLTGYPFDIFAAILQRSKMMICSNTGVMHLACALKVPVIAMHGPTNPVKWGPVGSRNQTIKSKLPCSPCLYLGFEYKCKYNNCMKDISVDEVLDAVDKIALICYPDY